MAKPANYVLDQAVFYVYNEALSLVGLSGGADEILPYLPTVVTSTQRTMV
ncbi:predicted protein [Plenodomus lingam JN3]|uniref:Predicted protein n=1 Tax=Leptosphaeria maculans (strain JN3 / isolate v23.1.3 / race Av1-4-5-6-7-8) TaxID=985895 RepID=E5A2S5_LEPMJ|nr:predicted protein [Plenodomus lingam JN3]CBX97871.1 predicted protein [Plenodomus lingam JN3]